MREKQDCTPGNHAPPEARILAAATHEFAAHGFYGARTQAIADAAGVNKAMLHYYFRSKENLYSHVIKGALQRILTQVGRAWFSEGSLDDRLKMVIDSYMDNYQENPGFLKIILREIVDGGDRFRRTFSQLEDIATVTPGFRPQEALSSVAEELGLTPLEATHMVVNLIGMCVISFISPLFLEALLDFDLSHFEGFLKQRRAAIKAMVLASTAPLRAGAHKE